MNAPGFMDREDMDDMKVDDLGEMPCRVENESANNVVEAMGSQVRQRGDVSVEEGGLVCFWGTLCC